MFYSSEIQLRANDKQRNNLEEKAKEKERELDRLQWLINKSPTARVDLSVLLKIVSANSS